MIEILLLVGSVHLVALISPGPDFALILRQSISHDRKTALWSAFGIALGVLVHVSYTLAGLNILMAYPHVLKIAGFLGAMYLLWLGIGALRSNPHKNQTIAKQTQTFSTRKALTMGFVVNATNPKCIVFFVSFLSAILAADHDRLTSVLIGIELFLLTWLWFSFVAIVIGHKHVQEKIQKYRGIADKIVGVLFIFFAIGIAFFITA